MLCYRSDNAAISYPGCIISTVTLLIFLLTPQVCTSFELLIGTGGVDSFSYFAGKTVCRSLKRYEKEFSCKLIPTEKAADRLTNLQSNSLDLALVSSKTIHDAVRDVGIFQYITINYNDLRLLMPLYRSPVLLIVRRDAQISSLDDLIGKRVNGGVLNTLENAIFNKLMTIKDWRKTDFSLYQNLPHAFSQDYLALKNGSVQAMLHVGMHPDNSLKQVLAESDSTLVGISGPDVMRLVDDKAGFSTALIPAGTYSGIKEDIHTLATETLLIASAATESDTVELVLTALIESKQQLQYAHPSLLQQEVRVATLNDSYLHPHPSALLFFQATRNLY